MNNYLIYLTAITATIFILVSSTAQAADVLVNTTPYCPANTSTDRYIINADVIFNCTAPVNIINAAAWNYAIFVNNSYTLDMNGTVLIGDNNGIGIQLGNNTIVKNGMIRDYDTGVFLNNSINNTVSNNTFDDNVHYDVYVISGSNNTITNNIVNNNIHYGMWFESISNTIISNNTVSNNLRGIYLVSGSNNTITNNIVNNNNHYGMWFESISNTIISNNTVNNNTAIGIYLVSGSNNTITNNIFNNHSSYGLFLDSSSNTIISNNTASDNDHEGIYLYSGSNNTIMNNIANNTKYGAGIIIVYISNTIISNNRVNNNKDGIYLYSGSNNTISNNIANDNKYGFKLEDNSNNNNLTSNTANNNNYSIYFYNSTNNTLINNIVLNSIEYDFYIDIDSIDNIIYNASINNSLISFTGKGISLKSSSPIGSIPSGYKSLGKHVNITNLSDADSWIFLNITYSDSDVVGMDENKLSIWRYNSTTWNKWTGLNGVNTAGKYVYANLTNFSIFDVMGLYDDTAPTITIASPTSTAYSSSSVALEVSADEPVSAWWYSLDGGPNTTFTPNITLSDLSNAQHMLVVYANDTVGNIKSEIVYFVVLVLSQLPGEGVFILPENVSSSGNATNITNVIENITTNVTNITSITNITNVTENITTNVTNITSIINITKLIEEPIIIFTYMGSIYIDVINKTSENIKQILSTIFRPPKYVCGNNICEEDEDTLVCPSDCPQKITLIHLAMIAALITALAAIGWAIKMRWVKRKKLLKILKTKR